jgi:hypothetical protein
LETGSETAEARWPVWMSAMRGAVYVVAAAVHSAAGEPSAR